MFLDLQTETGPKVDSGDSEIKNVASEEEKEDEEEEEEDGRLAEEEEPAISLQYHREVVAEMASSLETKEEMIRSLTGQMDQNLKTITEKEEVIDQLKEDITFITGHALAMLFVCLSLCLSMYSRASSHFRYTHAIIETDNH